MTSIAAKTYSRILLNHIHNPIDKLIRNNQAGFRSGRSCAQQIHILRRVIEGARAQLLPLDITFVDFKKAFDSIDRPMMFAILRHYGIPQKIVDAIQVLYDGSTSQGVLGGPALRAICCHNWSITRRRSSSVSIHQSNRLRLQAVCWKLRIPYT